MDKIWNKIIDYSIYLLSKIHIFADSLEKYHGHQVNLYERTDFIKKKEFT